MNQIFKYFIVALFLCFCFSSEAVSPEDINFRRTDGSVTLLIDPASSVSPSVRKALEDSLTNLRLKTTAEVVLAVVPDLDGMEPNQWCERLFTRMKLGKEKEDNGLLIMISPGDRKAFIMPGYGMEGIFTDIACKRISENVIKPAMQKGDLDMAVTDVTATVSKILSDPVAAEEIRSSQGENLNGVGSHLDPKVFMDFLRGIVAICFCISAIWFMVSAIRLRKLKTNYDRALGWRKNIKWQFVLTILSLGTGVIFLVITILCYRYWRTKKVKCPTCGSRMHRLPEDRDNDFLSPSQDFEEKLNTIDWDVWKCDECGTIERLPFRVPQKKYTECPNCHTVAMTLSADAVTRPATTRSEGEGVRTYTCRYCGHNDRKYYRIPRKSDDSALAAAAVLGAAASRGRNGGGGFGGGGFGGFGGFGGGSTGGGGAGSFW